MVRPTKRLVEVWRNSYSPLIKVSTQTGKVTNVSEMPCRLIDGLHEWRNEVLIVPS